MPADEHLQCCWKPMRVVNTAYMHLNITNGGLGWHVALMITEHAPVHGVSHCSAVADLPVPSALRWIAHPAPPSQYTAGQISKIHSVIATHHEGSTATSQKLSCNTGTGSNGWMLTRVSVKVYTSGVQHTNTRLSCRYCAGFNEMMHSCCRQGASCDSRTRGFADL